MCGRYWVPFGNGMTAGGEGRSVRDRRSSPPLTGILIPASTSYGRFPLPLRCEVPTGHRGEGSGRGWAAIPWVASAGPVMLAEEDQDGRGQPLYGEPHRPGGRQRPKGRRPGPGDCLPQTPGWSA
jgi:hypothetical protein